MTIRIQKSIYTLSGIAVPTATVNQAIEQAHLPLARSDHSILVLADDLEIDEEFDQLLFDYVDLNEVKSVETRSVLQENHYSLVSATYGVML